MAYSSRLLVIPRILRPAAVLICCVFVLHGQPKAIQPVGLVLAANGGTLKRHDRASTVALHPGEILFAGDVIGTGQSQSADVVFCPAKTGFRLNASTSVVFSDHEYRAHGVIANQSPQPVCTLPLLRPDNNGGDDYGLSLFASGEAGRQPVGTFERRMDALDPAARDQLRQQLAPIDAALNANRADAMAHIARASALERFGLYYDAGRELRQAAQLLGNPPWIAPLRNTADTRGVVVPAPAATGSTYALVVGISEFENLPAAAQLQYAHEDARSFAEYLESERGGHLRPDRDLKLLVNHDASLPAVENGLANFLVAQAREGDTVILFIASHGVIEPKTDDPYLLTAESDLEQLSSTAIPMSRILELLDSPRSKASRVLIFVDTCHAGRIGDFRSRFGDDLEKVLRSGHSGVFAFSASHASESSEEDARYGGGHGAFSYFLLRGLNTSEPNDVLDRKPDTISLKMLVNYVQQSVSRATSYRQNPSDMGRLDREIAIVTNLNAKGIPILPYPATASSLASRGAPRGLDSPDDLVRRFRDSIAAGHLLPGEQDSAFDQLPALQNEFGKDRQGYLDEENRLRVALENSGQRVILQYLKGDEIRQSAIEFDGGARAFEAAFRLTPEAHLLEAKALFCEGRARIGQHRYLEAVAALERAAALQPDAAYVWNALGLVYLESPDYDRAVLAFQDAIRLAPFWAYPRHNLALALRERGDLAGAIREYRSAFRLAPDFSYLHYNLGLLYQQINDAPAADEQYREAYSRAKSDPARARILVAQAVLVSRRNTPAALKLFDQALLHHPDPEDLLALRYDRALTVEHEDRSAARALWLANLADRPDHLPSLIALAGALDAWGETDPAIVRYTAILALKPEYVAARMRLAALLTPKDPARAVLVIEEGLRAAPRETRLLEQLGDAKAALKLDSESARAYCQALESNRDPALRRELLNKLKPFGGRNTCPAHP
jgi:tetratricopeptide (TPR) repeat protein